MSKEELKDFLLQEISEKEYCELIRVVGDIKEKCNTMNIEIMRKCMLHKAIQSRYFNYMNLKRLNLQYEEKLLREEQVYGYMNEISKYYQNIEINEWHDILLEMLTKFENKYKNEKPIMYEFFKEEIIRDENIWKLKLNNEYCLLEFKKIVFQYVVEGTDIYFDEIVEFCRENNIELNWSCDTLGKVKTLLIFKGCPWICNQMKLHYYDEPEKIYLYNCCYFSDVREVIARCKFKMHKAIPITTELYGISGIGIAVRNTYSNWYIEENIYNVFVSVVNELMVGYLDEDVTKAVDYKIYAENTHSDSYIEHMEFMPDYITGKVTKEKTFKINLNMCQDFHNGTYGVEKYAFEKQSKIFTAWLLFCAFDNLNCQGIQCSYVDISEYKKQLMGIIKERKSFEDTSDKLTKIKKLEQMIVWISVIVSKIENTEMRLYVATSIEGIILEIQKDAQINIIEALKVLTESLIYNTLKFNEDYNELFGKVCMKKIKRTTFDDYVEFQPERFTNVRNELVELEKVQEVDVKSRCSNIDKYNRLFYDSKRNNHKLYNLIRSSMLEKI